jgi:hypothetical protein
MTSLPVAICATAAVAWDRAAVPALLAAVREHASVRFLEFFAANIRNPHARRAYYRAAKEFLCCVRASACRRLRDNRYHVESAQLPNSAADRFFAAGSAGRR